MTANEERTDLIEEIQGSAKYDFEFKPQTNVKNTEEKY